MRRWLRTLHVQLLLWALLPVTFAILGLALTGVYAHQRQMRDFVAERNLALARLTARMLEAELAHGDLAPDRAALTAWLARMVGDQFGAVSVVGLGGEVMAHTALPRGGCLPSGVAARMVSPPQREGARIVYDAQGNAILLASAPVGNTGWTVIVQEPVNEIIGPILRFSGWAPAIAVSAGLLSLVVLALGYRTIVKPLQHLSHAAGQVTWGDYSAIAAPIGGVQEVRDLHRAMREMVERIQGYQAGMQDYLGAISQGQEAERARLARELHDGPVQELIGLAQRAEMAQRLLRRGEVARAQTLLGELRRAGLSTVDELRRIIGALRPIYLDDLGFLPALEMLVRRMAKRASARVILETDGPISRCAPEIELAAYRIAQEALRNAVQHAHARQIVVRVRCDGQGLTLSVRDDGVGFTLPPRPDILTQEGHFGLVGIQERVTRLGGTLRIHTAPGRGTRITVHLPAQSRSPEA